MANLAVFSYARLTVVSHHDARNHGEENWALTSTAFARLLEWLDDGEDSDGRVYLEMRRRLVSYFERKNCVSPEDLVDETMNRVARRLEEEGSIIDTETPAKYLYITARFVFLESLRAHERTDVPLENRRFCLIPLRRSRGKSQPG